MKAKNETENSKIEPTKSELEILQVLWEHGPSSVRFVNDKLNERREINYTSTLKLMQIMAEKEILKRDESAVKHIYHVTENEEKTKRHLLKKFVDSMYNGSASKLVVQLLGNGSTTKEDVEEIRDLLNKINEE
nr:BlaI/MecI/CopY family transcriptional regulator [Pedobacter panaciterrae]